MSRWKGRLVIGAGLIGLVAGGLDAIAPRTPAEIDEQRRQQQVEQLSDADEQSKERLREHGADAAEAERRRRLVPAEPRPPEPHPRIQVRLP